MTRTEGAAYRSLLSYREILYDKMRCAARGKEDVALRPACALEREKDGAYS